VGAEFFRHVAVETYDESVLAGVVPDEAGDRFDRLIRFLVNMRVSFIVFLRGSG
jgi:hypothetical protein